MRRYLRETAFKVARRDLATFLVEHEQDLILVFREELHRLDDELPEEKLFIDIRMAALGEALLRVALKALVRFLNDDIPPRPAA
jgi:hypothetical protein